MIKLAVIDPGAPDITGKILEGIREYGGGTDIGVCRFEALSVLHGICPDVLVLSPEAGVSPAPGPENKPAASRRTACGIALLPGDTARAPSDTGAAPLDAAAAAFDAGCVVTYGMSPKNTITLSSIGESSCVLALQREFLTATGGVLDRQEIRIRGGMKPDILLAVMGTLLVCGVKLPDINP